jgi:hypothetical protein
VLSAYRVAEKLEWIRNGAAFDNEMAARKRDSNENESEARLRDSYWVPLKRIADSSEDFAALNKARLLARVHIGIEAANAIEELLRVRVEVHTASQTLVRSVGQLGGNQDFLEKMRCKIWAMDDEHDELTKRSKAALAKLDQVCLPHLR